MKRRSSNNLKRSRREWSDRLQRFRERFERYAIYVVALNVGVFWLSRWKAGKAILLSAWLRCPGHEHVPVEAFVVGVETATVALALSKVLWDLFALKDESKFWSNGCNKLTIASLADWFRGDPVELGSITRHVCVEFAEEENVQNIISDFNHRAYEYGYFGLRRNALFERNKAIMRKNPHTFLLYKDKNSDDKPFAFSCILPLNEAATEDYLQARIPDSGFKDRHIASPGERPRLIVLFALALDPNFKIPPGGKEAGNYPAYIAGCLQHHFCHLLSQVEGRTDFPPVVVQAETWRTRRTYRRLGFNDTRTESADRMTFLEMQSPFAHFPMGERDGRIQWKERQLESSANQVTASQTTPWLASLPLTISGPLG